ncbi:unnamed protein product [Gordionus sp. m RMFG-2023]
METTSRLVDLGDFYLQVTLIKKHDGMTLGEGRRNENQPPTYGIRRKRCYNCQGEGHLRHQCTQLPRDRVPMGVLSENPRVDPHEGQKRIYNEMNLGQPTTSVL